MSEIHNLVREQIELLADETHRGTKPRIHITVGVGFQARITRCADLLAQYGYDVTSPIGPDGVNRSSVVEIVIMLFLADHGFSKDLEPLPEVLEG